MNTFWLIFGAALGLMWTFRLVQTALGMRRVPDLTRAQWESQAGADWPRVSIVVPARNEEQGIEPAVQSLLALDYPNYEVLAINDRSNDRTGEILDRLAGVAGGRLRLIDVSSLPPEWLGKTHAMHIGATQATGEWLLFTDADVVFRPDTLRRAINFSLTTAADHCVLAPTMLLKSWGERTVGGFFQCMFVLYWGHSPWRVANPGARDYMGVGAFNLIRRTAFDGIGGMGRLRMEVIEDLKLGKLVKRCGFQQRAAFGHNLVTLHWAQGALGMVRNLTKNFFALMNYRWPRALSAVLGLLLVNLPPFIGTVLATGWTRLGYGVALACIAAMYVGMSRYSPVSPYYFFLHPLGTFLIAYSVLRSTVLTLWRDGVVWRGTRYPLEALRRGIV